MSEPIITLDKFVDTGSVEQWNRSMDTMKKYQKLERKLKRCKTLKQCWAVTDEIWKTVQPNAPRPPLTGHE